MSEIAARMNTSWLRGRQSTEINDDAVDQEEPLRVWRSFLVARTVLGLVLVGLHGGILLKTATQQDLINAMLSGLYLAVCLGAGVWFKPRPLSEHLDTVWAATIGIDVLIFTIMQSLPGSGLNYAPLFTLPVLMASMLGSTRMGMGTSALITLALFTGAAWTNAQNAWSLSDRMLQAALTGAGCFLIAFLSAQLATKWVASERKAERNRRAALMQRQINALVVDALAEGILVANRRGGIRLINPTARKLIGMMDEPERLDRRLGDRQSWQPLLKLVESTYQTQFTQVLEVEVQRTGRALSRLLVQAELTTAVSEDAERLCVLIIKDAWELQSRIQNDKLASMGRMSAALAHEIRNPLAAIVHANALLQEDLGDAASQKLTGIVQQNAGRLERIIADVLGLVQSPGATGSRDSPSLPLESFCRAVCEEWQAQKGVSKELAIRLATTNSPTWVAFEPDHLRRILINLLDNAWRHANRTEGCIQVYAQAPPDSTNTRVQLHIWSNGAPITSAAQQHLFEPFFSTQSRSTGLGLYICRELCQRNSAKIDLDIGKPGFSEGDLGNDFHISMDVTPAPISALNTQSDNV